MSETIWCEGCAAERPKDGFEFREGAFGSFTICRGCVADEAGDLPEEHLADLRFMSDVRRASDDDLVTMLSFEREDWRRSAIVREKERRAGRLKCG